jgi:CubicO group peptidase (beta-lactamase class C family)
MQSQVFDPLGMTATTLDYARALAGNHAMPHAPDIDGKPAHVAIAVDYAIVPLRPAGGAWSSVRDVAKYVQMELAEGTLPDGKRYIGKAPLFQRRESQVAVGNDVTYGMGLTVENKYGVTLIHHGGDLSGFHSDMIWLPEHHVGAVILTNGDPGSILRNGFRRKLLELLFDGHPEAERDVAARAKTFFAELAAERKLMTVPADAAEANKLAARYHNAALGDLTVSHAGPAIVFDVGEWKSEVASRKNPDGSVSFLTIAPGLGGNEFVVGPGTKRTLIVRDAQHEYVFDPLK